ncbi:MAG: BsuPI-related putative proteinase inhibitor [Candidatus Hadarchaeota archaeon]
MSKLVVVGLVAVCVAGIFLTAVLFKGGQGPKSENIGNSENVGENSASIIENGIKLTLTLSKTGFNLGENIPMNLTVQNIRAENVSLEFSSGYQSDFIVYDTDFNKVCAWSDGKMFIMSFTGFGLGPGENRSWVWDWDQKVYNNQTGEYSPIAPGEYYLRGILVRYSTSLTTPSLKITVHGLT